MTDKNAEIKINITANKMRVLANYMPPVGEGEKLTPEKVLTELELLKVKTGIKYDDIKAMCESSVPMNPVVLAEGESPGIGENARIETYIKFANQGKVVEKNNGTVDYHDLGEIVSIKANQELYKKIPLTIGTPGKNVLGEEIPGLPGRDLKIVLGSGTEFDKDDPNLVRASIEGEVLIKKGIMQVSMVHIVNGDIDFSTGNVNFKGSIKINGAVKSGFKVEADGNIEINGNVEDAIVISENDININGGFAGTGNGLIKSKRDVNVKFVENQRIEADRDIMVSVQAYHATLLAGRSIYVKGKKGAIIGGRTEAKNSVETDYLGSEAGIPTKIIIGTDFKLGEKIKTIENEIQATNESMDKLEKSVVFLYRQKIDSKGVLSTEKAELLEKLEKAKATSPKKLKELLDEKENLIKELGEVDQAFAVAERVVYPNVQIHIGQQWITLEETLGPSSFRISSSEIVRMPR